MSHHDFNFVIHVCIYMCNIKISNGCDVFNSVASLFYLSLSLIGLTFEKTICIRCVTASVKQLYNT